MKMTKKEAIAFLDILDDYVEKIAEKKIEANKPCDDSWCGYVDTTKERDCLFKFLTGEKSTEE